MTTELKKGSDAKYLGNISATQEQENNLTAETQKLIPRPKN